MGLVKTQLSGSLLLSLVKSRGFLSGAKSIDLSLDFPCFVVVVIF